jgi:Region found in RelA / SpoT proteins
VEALMAAHSFPTDRAELEFLLDSSDCNNATRAFCVLLKSNLIHFLGGKWDDIRKEYGLSTITTRPKSTGRALEKFDSLLAKGRPITAANFYEYMPDLAAARLLIVDPADLFKLAEKVRHSCVPPVFEDPGQAFVRWRLRYGTLSTYNAKTVAEFEQAGYDLKPEDAGYCSVHFVFRPGVDFFPRWSEDHECLRHLNDKQRIPMTGWHLEVQIRTLMEEAWGETDHFVRYADPNLRKNPAVVSHFAALSGYLQAANHHVSLIRKLARENIA